MNGVRRKAKEKNGFTDWVEVCERLNISRGTFWQKWHRVFTDPRPEADRRAGCERKIYRDELEIAIEQSAHCPAAIINYRKKKKRIS